MTITLHAPVYSRHGVWFAYAHALDHTNPAQPFSIKTRIKARLSWPEAMQQAHKLLADIDDELMEEVHASRATRRQVTS